VRDAASLLDDCLENLDLASLKAEQVIALAEAVALLVSRPGFSRPDYEEMWRRIKGAGLPTLPPVRDDPELRRLLEAFLLAPEDRPDGVS
jgi:hypothetical protein